MRAHAVPYGSRRRGGRATPTTCMSSSHSPDRSISSIGVAASVNVRTTNTGASGVSTFGASLLRPASVRSPATSTASIPSLVSTSTRRHRSRRLTAGSSKPAATPRFLASTRVTTTNVPTTVTVPTGTSTATCRVGPVTARASRNLPTPSSHDHRADPPAPTPERGGGRG